MADELNHPKCKCPTCVAHRIEIARLVFESEKSSAEQQGRFIQGLKTLMEERQRNGR